MGTKLEGYDKDGYVGTQIRRLNNSGWINVWDYRTSKPSGIMCDGTDDYPAFVAARDAITSGQQATIYVPRGAYTLNTSVTDNGRYIRCYVEAGSTFSGVGILFTTVRYFDNSIKSIEYVTGTPTSGDVLAKYSVFQNNSSSTVGYGQRMDYLHSGTPTAGFDIADSIVARWNGMNGGTGLVRWDVYHTPNSNTWVGGFIQSEMNPVNRGPDMGWSNKPGALARWVGGIRFVPESVDFSGQGGTGRHVLFALSTARSGTNNSDGVRARVYNAILVEPDSIAPAGYGVYVNGSTSGTTSEWYTALGAQDSLKTGIDFTGATFLTNYAMKLAAGQKLSWFTSSTENAYVVGTSTYLALYSGASGYITATIPDSTSTGGNTRGANSVDLQSVRSSASQVASGARSVTSGGTGNSATGQESFIGGGKNNVASGQGSIIPGGEANTASGRYSTAFGASSSTRGTWGKMVLAPGNFAAGGDAQMGLQVLRLTTTDATTTPITATAGGTASDSALVLPNNGAYAFTGEVVARNTSTNDVVMWQVTGLVRRGANAAATALVGSPTVTKAFNDAGASTWTLAVVADTTNGAVQFNATGAAATTVRWVASIRTTEVA